MINQETNPDDQKAFLNSAVLAVSGGIQDAIHISQEIK